MIISKETIENLKSQGIYVSMFPSEKARAEAYAKKLASNEERYRYISSTSRYCEKTGKWIEEGEERKNYKEYAKQMTDASFEKTEGYWGMWYDATTLYVGKEDMLFKRAVNKGRCITEDMVHGIIEREQKAYMGPYGQFAKDIHKMFHQRFGSTGFVYPTTYGIGVWVFFNSHKQECIDNVASLLDRLGIEYTNEFSDANLVYRFRISKKEVNRIRLQNAIA